MNTTQFASLEPGFRLQLPSDWAKALGLQGLVALEKTPEGILIHPPPRASWDDIFANKLAIASPLAGPVDVEVTRDDLIF